MHWILVFMLTALLFVVVTGCTSPTVEPDTPTVDPYTPVHVTPTPLTDEAIAQLSARYRYKFTPTPNIRWVTPTPYVPSGAGQAIIHDTHYKVWPFTASSVILICAYDMVWVETLDGREYPLNGNSKQIFADIPANQWNDIRKKRGTGGYVDIGTIIQEGLQLCR